MQGKATLSEKIKKGKVIFKKRKIEIKKNWR